MYCLGTQNGAIEYMRRIRNMPPGIYNERRLRERPIPDDEVGIEESFEEILIPGDSNGDDSPNTTSNASTNPLDIFSDDNVEAHNVSSVSNQHSNRDGSLETEIQTNEMSVASTANESTLSENQTEISVITNNSNSSDVTTNNNSQNDTMAINNDSRHEERFVDENTVAEEIIGDDLVPLQVSVVGDAEEVVPNRAIGDNSLQERSSIENAHQSTSVIDSVSVGPSNDTECNNEISNDNDTLLLECENATSNDVDSDDQVEFKPNVAPLYQVYRTNNTDILNQLEEYVIDYADDDIEIAISSKGYAAPFNTTLEGLVKPEKPSDFSGWIPSLNTVSH